MRDNFSRQVELKAERKIRAQRTPAQSAWLGYGMTGAVGWVVTLPALLGALLGYWLDGRYPSAHSWTFALLMAGLCLGCFQAWMWVAREDKAMHEPQDGLQSEPQEAQKDETENA